MCNAGLPKLFAGRARAGKIYLYNYIIRTFRQDIYNVSTSTWTGIAAILQYGIYLTFKVYLNLAWPDTTSNFGPNQSWCDCQHLLTRAFQQYMWNILLDLWENGVLRRSLVMIHISEFQQQPLYHITCTFSSNHSDKKGKDSLETKVSQSFFLYNLSFENY